MKLSTTCSLPPELTDQQLWEALDGIADEATTSHLQQCPYCQNRAKAFEYIQNRLKSRLFRATCPPSLELAEFYIRTLPATQMLVISAHVRGCLHCAREVAELGEFMGDLITPPETRLPGESKMLVARLVNISPSFGALRGETKGPLVFEADSIVITLDVQSSSHGQVSIQGQVAADDQDQWTGAIVKLQQTDLQELAAVVDDLGAFIFQGLTLDPIQLEITSPTGVEVQIPNIDIAV